MTDLYFNGVYNNACKQCERVRSAIDQCDEAYRRVAEQLTAIQDNWKGEAGTALYDALYLWNADLLRTSAKLVALKNRMNQEALAVLTEWPQRLEEQRGGE